MAAVSEAQIESAYIAADRAFKLGNLVYSIAIGLFWVLTVGLGTGLVLIYRANHYRSYDSYTDWSAVWFGWGVLIGAWLIYSFGLAMIALVGAVAQAKAESLDLQITQAQP